MPGTVILAKSAGFCYGVRRAVDLARKTAVESGGCWMLGDLIHNANVVGELADAGVRKTTEPETLGAGDTVVIRSHGELKRVLDGLEAGGGLCQRHLPQCVPDPKTGGPGRAGGPPGRHHRGAPSSGGHGTCQLVPPAPGIQRSGGCPGVACRGGIQTGKFL